MTIDYDSKYIMICHIRRMLEDLEYQNMLGWRVTDKMIDEVVNETIDFLEDYEH